MPMRCSMSMPRDQSYHRRRYLGQPEGIYVVEPSGGSRLLE